MYYCEGFGFWVLRGDATNPYDSSRGDAWHSLNFDYEDVFSTYLTNAGQECSINWTRPDQRWPRMLLPDVYHNPQKRTVTRQYGGLRGDLPIFLGLVAFSMPRNHLIQLLPQMLQGGIWGYHRYPHERE